MNHNRINVAGSQIGDGAPVFVIAEMSANHGQDYEQAVKLLHAAHAAGANAVKLQHYTPDTMTIDSRNECFMVGKGTIWEGRNLYKLYSEASTPWEWYPDLQQVADELGLILFSTPFDLTAVDFLEQYNPPVYKIASFEVPDIELLRSIGATGRPVIMSTGMASLAEIEEAVRILRDAGIRELALLKCTSAYPALPNEMNLRTIPHLSEAFGVPAGLSDHTMGTAVPVAAVALGACIVEKHFTLSRDVPGPDSSFSLEPPELSDMVEAIRTTEQALGRVCYDLTEQEAASRVFRRSLFVVRDMQAGDVFTLANVRIIRPGDGMLPRYLDTIIGRHAAVDIARGTPIRWDLIE
jgi:pseudaminic acid synthase